jgi:5'(3')-deoxyribonucleotidase
MRLGIDLDGVVADFTTGFVAAYNRDFGDEHGYIYEEDVVSWGFMVDLTHFKDTSEAWQWIQYAGSTNKEAPGVSLFKELDIIDGSLGVLQRLSKAHEIVIITSKPEFAIADTFFWLSRWKIPTSEVHITQDKHEVKCDVYLDDGQHNLIALSERCPESLVCRYVQPWNSGMEGVLDVYSWAQFEMLMGLNFQK